MNVELTKQDTIAIIDFLEVFADYVEADPHGAKSVAQHALEMRVKLLEKCEAAFQADK
jgi:hypothetical protein